MPDDFARVLWNRNRSEELQGEFWVERFRDEHRHAQTTILLVKEQEQRPRTQRGIYCEEPEHLGTITDFENEHERMELWRRPDLCLERRARLEGPMPWAATRASTPRRSSEVFDG